MASMKTTVLRDNVFREPHLNGLLGAHAGNYVIRGKEPAITQRAAGANMSVDVGAFTYVLNGVLGIKSSTTNVVVANSDANPRIDLLYIDPADGIIKILKGTARAKKPATEANWLKWEEPYPASFSAIDGLLLAEIEVPANATSILNENIRNIAVPALPANFDSMYSVQIYQRGTEIIAKKADGTVLDSGTVGTDDTDIFDAAVAGCPDGGSIGIGPGVYTLLANKQFYLSGTIEAPENPFYYAIGIMEAKNIHLIGAGRGVTTLKMANSQHDADHHCVLILNRATGPTATGHTGFSVENMTLDGNKANQAVAYHDGSGLVLTGSTRSNERFEDLELINSFGYGIYSGNNGSGFATGLLINNIYASGCYKSAICTDTARNAAISDCVIVDCGLEVMGNTNYATRAYDNVAVSNVSCLRAGITIWCVNGVVMTGCTADLTGVAVACYGLQIHCSYNVNIVGCQFTAGKTNGKYASYIDGGGYIADGVYSQVRIRDSTFDGFWALKVFGSAIIRANDCTFHGYTDGANIGSAVLLREISEAVTAKVYLVDCELVADAVTTRLADVAAYSQLHLRRCHAANIGAFLLNGALSAQDCTGPGLEGYNSRWRQEEGTFTATPASTSTITMTVDRTAAIPPGTPLVYFIGGTPKYGIVTAITANLMTIAGAPLSGNIDQLFIGCSEMVGQIDYLIPGVFDASASSTLIQTLQKSYSVWRGRPAYLVRIQHKAVTADSGTAPNVTATIAGNVVGTDNSNTGQAVSTSLVSTVVGINTSNYKADDGEVIELKTTQGGTGNATYLTVLLTFVSES